MTDDPDHPEDRSPNGSASGPWDGEHAVGPGTFQPFLQQASRAQLMARVAALEGTLATLPAIEQAKGALMATYGISADAAFALLRFHSQTRNVKVRAIAAQLTTLMSSSPSSNTAITRLDRLLDRVSRNLQKPSTPADQQPNTATATAARGAAGGLHIDADDLAQVMLQSMATVPPGITIAGYTTGMPLIYANEAFTEITGYPMSEITGRNCKFLQGRATDPAAISKLSHALHHGQDTSVVIRNYRRDGTPFWNEVSISPIRNRTDQITHYIGTQINITERDFNAAQVR